MFGPSVQLTRLGARDGIMEGEYGRFAWEARLARGPVSYGLNPQTLYKGSGRVARFVLYEVLPGTRVKQKVAAFDKGWLFGRRTYAQVVGSVIRYLERA